METIRQTQKKYGSRAMYVALVGGFILILASYRPIGKGLILGTLFSVINFVLMGETLSRRMDGSRRKASVLSFLWILLRYGVMAIPLIVGIRYGEFHLAGVIVGIFMVQIMILADHLTSNLRPGRRKSGS